MNDFDKLGYWKERMNKALSGSFEYVLACMRDIKTEFAHVGGDTKKFDEAYLIIAHGYDKMKDAIDSIPKAEEKPVEEKPVEEGKPTS